MPMIEISRDRILDTDQVESIVPRKTVTSPLTSNSYILRTKSGDILHVNVDDRQKIFAYKVGAL